MIDINEKLNKFFSPKGKKIFLATICVAGLIIIYLLVSFFVQLQQPAENSQQEPVINASQESVIPQTQVSTEMKELDLSGMEQAEDKMVALADENVGRSDPFLPNKTLDKTSEDINLVAPPTTISFNENASKIFTTRVSGIMYDSKNPSAILNIEGMDYFVKSGDYLSGYQILSIKKDYITLQSGKNVYKVKVGQLVSSSSMLTNYDASLNKKFGGAKK